MNKKIISILVCFVLFLGAPVTASEEITVCLNGTPLEFDVPPQIVNDRTLAPVRAIAESFELDVDWKQQEKTVMITQRETGVPEKSDTDTDKVEEVLFTSLLLPGDNAVYPIFMRDIALVDKNGTCYCAQTTLYRILTMSKYGYRFVEIPNHPNFPGFDMAVDIPLGIEGGFSTSGTGKTGALFDKNDRGKRYLYSAEGLPDHAPAIWYGSRCYLVVTDVLDFFEIPYERVTCDDGNNVIIELKESEDLKQINE